jgi:hypothetical protein
MRKVEHFSIYYTSGGDIFQYIFAKRKTTPGSGAMTALPGVDHHSEALWNVKAPVRG